MSSRKCAKPLVLWFSLTRLGKAYADAESLVGTSDAANVLSKLYYVLFCNEKIAMNLVFCFLGVDTLPYGTRTNLKDRKITSIEKNSDMWITMDCARLRFLGKNFDPLGLKIRMKKMIRQMSLAIFGISPLSL